jgi:hypothetical protein
MVVTATMAWPAHRAVAVVVKEQHARMRAGRDWFGEDGAGHVGVATRLEHERPAKMIRVPARPLALGEHRAAAGSRKSVDHQAQRLAGHVGVDGSDDHERRCSRPPWSLG